MRVGLAAGHVLSVFGDVYGPDVNLASRLVAVGDASTVVVSEVVRTACANAFRFDALPPLSLKGFVDPVTAYRLLDQRSGDEPTPRG